MILFRFLVAIPILLCLSCLPSYVLSDTLEHNKLNLLTMLTNEDRDSMNAISRYFQSVVDDIAKNKLLCDSDSGPIYNLKLKNQEYDVVSALKLAITIVDKTSEPLMISYPITEIDSHSLMPKFLSITSLNDQDLLTIFSFFRNAIIVFDKIQDADSLFIIIKSSLKILCLIEVYDDNTFQRKLAGAGVCVKSFNTLLLNHHNFGLKNKPIIKVMLKKLEEEITSSFKEYIYSKRIMYVYQISTASDTFSMDDCLEDKAKLKYIDSLIHDEFFQWKKIEPDWEKRRNELLTNLMAIASKEHNKKQYYPKASEEKIHILLTYYNSYKIVREIKSLFNKFE